MKSDTLTALFVVAILVLAGFGAVALQNNQHEQIREWAATQRYRVDKIETASWNRGPYWHVDEDDPVYRVEVSNSDHLPRVFYVHFYWGGMETKESK